MLDPELDESIIQLGFVHSLHVDAGHATVVLRLPTSWCAVNCAYAGLSVAMAFVHLRPRYFGEIMANLLFWLGPDKLCFGSDYAIWSPKWLIDKFMAYDIPEDLQQEYHASLTLETKRKILGENTARLYGIDIAAQQAKLRQDGVGL